MVASVWFLMDQKEASRRLESMLFWDVNNGISHQTDPEMKERFSPSKL
jgi:hypothetical protein